MKIFDAIQQIEPCPRTKSTGCQCDRLDVISEAEETVKAIAQLEHTVGDVQGAVKFKQKPGQPTIIKGIVKGLTPGKHGFHIHEFGDLSDGCASAGGHYNPDGVDHGSLKQGHVGDLGNIVADKSGTARFQLKAERVELKDVVGRAIVIHADEDDLGKGGDEESLKTGNAGERVGCGVIRLREVVEENYSRKVSDKHFDRNQLPQIRRPDIQDSPFKYKEGKISIKVIKPVQTQRVPGLAKKSQNVFLQDIDRPFIVDKKGYLINGHHRYDAAHMLGMRTVPAIMIDADIEDVMNYFAHTRSNTEVVEHYFKKLYEKKLKEKGTRCWKGYKKKGMKTMFGKRVPNCVKNEGEVVNFPGTYVKKEYVDINGVKMLKDVWDYMSQDREEEHGFDDNANRVHKGLNNFTGNEDPKVLKKAYQMELRNFIDEFENQGMDPQPFIDELDQLEEDVVGMNPQAKKPYFTPDEADRANNEWINQAQVDQGDGVILNGTDGKQYRIMTSYGNQHFEDGEVYLDGVSDPNYIDTEGYPDAAELLYYHSATGHYPDDELEEAKSSPGRVKRAGASCKGSVSELRRKAKKYSGEKGKMYHWCANMKGGKKKK